MNSMTYSSACRWRVFLALLASVFVLVPSLARAGADQVGTTAANFLSIGTGPGILGMGGATLGLGGNLEAVSWNVASLGWLRQTELVFSHAGLPDGTTQEWLSTGGRVGSSLTRWSMSGLYQTLGTVEGRDASNNPTSDLRLSSMAMGAHVARPFGEIVTVGVGAKWVTEDLGVVRGSGVTFDAGLQLRRGIVGLGLAAQNAFGKMGYSGARYDFPTSYGAGVAIDHRESGLRGALDVNFPSAYYTNVRGGVEWMWKERVALRAGYRAELGAPSDEALNGPSFGMGAGGYGLWFDYGYLLTTSNQGQHRMGLTWSPGRIHWAPGDPFGQKSMPREYGPAPVPGAPYGPPAPEPGRSPKK